jgi:hypothetical protein
VRTYLSARPPAALVLAWDLCSQRARSSGGRSNCAGQGLERPAWAVTAGRTYVQLRAADQQPRVLAYGGSVATRQFFADTMRAAGFTSVTVAEEPQLEVAQFDVAVQLASFPPHYRNGLAEEAARDPLAYAFLLHSSSSVDYSPGLPGATGLRWLESRLHAELCRALAQRVLFTDSGAYRVPARGLRIDILDNPKAAGGVHAILGMRPKAFAAAMSSVTGDAFAPAKALGNVPTFYVRARTVLDATSVVIASWLDRMRSVADAVHRVKRAAEGGGSAVASKRPRFRFARRLG